MYFHKIHFLGILFSSILSMICTSVCETLPPAGQKGEKESPVKNGNMTPLAVIRNVITQKEWDAIPKSIHDRLFDETAFVLLEQLTSHEPDIGPEGAVGFTFWTECIIASHKQNDLWHVQVFLKKGMLFITHEMIFPKDDKKTISKNLGWYMSIPAWEKIKQAIVENVQADEAKHDASK